MNNYRATKSAQRYLENFSAYVYGIVYKFLVFNIARTYSNLSEYAYG